ncbi:MAG: amidohydrolase family protein [Gammaproteobacteria bacterium]|nr:amidohydrolase family protein [Gammaproteobacteria bacterium]
MLIRGAEIDGQIFDVRVQERIETIAPCLTVDPDEEVVDAAGCALLPGLWDHHIHLFATDALQRSVDCSPQVIANKKQLAEELLGVSGKGWIRGFGFHESTIGEITRYDLDEFGINQPIRLQHRSGKLWVLNTRALLTLGIVESKNLHEGVECDKQGIPTGRLFRMDGWLTKTLASTQSPNLSILSNKLLGYGVTGVTDASYTNTCATQYLFDHKHRHGEFAPHVVLMGDETVLGGPLKIMLDDDNLPNLDALVIRVNDAHAQSRTVAFHCVSRVELLFAVAALQQAEKRGRDRIEHGGIIPLEMAPVLAALGCRVVTQPGFISHRGEQFRRLLESSEIEDLYRYQSLLDAGVAVVASSDAPYGPLDPWLIMHAAVSRTTEADLKLGADEAVSPEEALSGYLSHPQHPGDVRRKLVVGEQADICLLDKSWQQARSDLNHVKVNYTWMAGSLVYVREPNTSSECSPK